MSDTIVFSTNPRSRGRILRRMLEELGAPPCRAGRLARGAAVKAPADRALTPMGKMPRLMHGDRVVTACAAIRADLADALPAAGLAPAFACGAALDDAAAT